MKIRSRAASDDWVRDGRNILTVENVAAIQAAIGVGPLLVERWFYQGGSGPDYHVFDDYEDYLKFLNEETCAGDSIYIWDIRKVCQDTNTVTQGKCPDDEGLVPLRGAY